MSPKKSSAEAGGTLSGFAAYLRRYMGAWPVLLACLIGPITKYLHLLPAYKDHENILAGTTSLYGFLLAAALFYYRPALAAGGKSGSEGKRRAILWLPSLLIAASLALLFGYVFEVQVSVRVRRELLQEVVEPSQLSTPQILARTDFTNIPNGGELLGLYLAAFLTAETSLVVMALAEFVRTNEKGRRERRPKAPDVS